MNTNARIFRPARPDPSLSGRARSPSRFLRSSPRKSLFARRRAPSPASPVGAAGALGLRRAGRPRADAEGALHPAGHAGAGRRLLELACADRTPHCVSRAQYACGRSPRLTGAADALHSGTAIQRELLEGVLVELLALRRALRRRYGRDGLVLRLVRRFLRIVGEGVKIMRPLAELVLVALGLGVLLRDTTGRCQRQPTRPSADAFTTASKSHS